MSSTKKKKKATRKTVQRYGTNYKIPTETIENKKANKKLRYWK